MKEYLLKIFNYNHWCTEVLIEIIEKEKVTDEFVLRMLSHYLNVCYIRFDNINPGKSKKPGLWDVHPVKKLKDMNDEIAEKAITFLSKMKPREAMEKIHTVSTDGDEIIISKGDMFIHIVNHAAHHRGQICTRLREIGITPPGIGYLRYAHSFPDFW